jgi:hypothetical protein
MLLGKMTLHMNLDEFENADCFVVVTEYTEGGKSEFLLTGSFDTAWEAEKWADMHRVEVNAGYDENDDERYRVYVKPVGPHAYPVRSPDDSS